MTDMSSTEGAWPIDPTTAVGLFRFAVGDVVGAPHDSADGRADFEFMSDSTIEALIVAYPDAATARSVALSSMATQLIASAQDIQVDDIKIKTVERAGLMLKLSTALAEGAIIGDAASAFDIVPLTAANSYWTRAPQGVPRAYGESGF